MIYCKEWNSTLMGNFTKELFAVMDLRIKIKHIESIEVEINENWIKKYYDLPPIKDSKQYV